MKQVHLQITGMTCAACSARIEKVLGKMEGVKEVNVNLATETSAILYDPNLLSANDLREKIEKDMSKPQYIETVWGAGYRFCRL